MSVIAGVLTEAYVLVAADRALIDPTQEIVDGVPALLSDQDKLFVTPGGVGVAMAGLIGDGTPQVDLLAAARAAALPSDPGAAAVTVTALFDRMAPLIRTSPAASGSGAFLLPFEQEVLTVALVAGVTAAGPDLWVVGLTAAGRCLATRLDKPGTAYGPREERASLALAVSTAAGLNPADAGSHLEAAISEVAVRNRASVSVDCDWLLIGPDGVSDVVRYRPRLRVPRGV